MKQGGIIFDFDDTLVYTNQVFDRIKNEFIAEMQAMRLADEQILTVLNQFDIANVQKYGGFFKECFPFALGETYAFYCTKYGVQPDFGQKARFIRLGESAYEVQPEEVPQARQLLAKLRKADFLLFLLTKGDPALQQERLAKSGLWAYFHSIEIVPQKTTMSFANLLKAQQLLAKKSWSIGNSIKADINTALVLGLNCIHVPNPSWDFETEPAVGDYYVAERLLDCIGIING